MSNSESKSQGSSSKIVIFAALIVGAVAMVVVGMFLGLFDSEDKADPAEPVPAPTAAEPAPPTQEPTMSPEEIAEMERQTMELIDAQHRLIDGDPRALGALDAPVVIETYKDYNCGYCQAFHIDVFGELQPLIDDGTIRIEQNFMPVLGEASFLAAKAALAAANQNGFWEYDHALYTTTLEKTPENLLAIAEELGIFDMAQFEADMNSEETAAIIQSEYENAMSLGITGTPAFLIGYSYVPGYIEADQFISVIESELNRK
ncbi:MAG: thioredoxin domain-containing protein [Actinomycetaceae bacterium]|nr:thioredoxin domain-containing protein [Actinomycetaceae bacterium]